MPVPRHPGDADRGRALIGKGHVATTPNHEVTADQVTGLPAEVGRAVRDLVGEYEARETTEARLAKDADKLECLLQAREYQAQGHGDVAAWIESSAGLRSASARRLADACRRVRPGGGGRPSPGRGPGRPGPSERGRTARRLRARPPRRGQPASAAAPSSRTTLTNRSRSSAVVRQLLIAGRRATRPP